MHIRAILFASLIACGGSTQQTQPNLPPDPQPDPSAEVTPQPTPDPVPPEVPLDPPAPVTAAPKMSSAQVELAPTLGGKMKPVTITIDQTEGQPAKIAEVEIVGLRPGKYQLLVHDSADCGKDASKLPQAEPANQIIVEVTKDAPGKLPATELDLKLDGDLIGKTLVLHELRAGAPGPAQACGQIVSQAKAPANDPPAG